MSNEKEKKEKREKNHQAGGQRRSARKGKTGDRKRNGQPQKTKRLAKCMKSQHTIPQPMGQGATTPKRSEVAL